MRQDTSSGSIIVVDDEQSVRNVVARALQKKGFNVVTAEDAFDALEKVSRQQFDLMFLDIRMPEMSGLKLLSIMHTCHPGTPVIMLTGVRGLRPYYEAKEHEAFAYLRKPCSLSKITMLAEKLLSDHKERQPAAASTSA
ncbi:MAG: response regulator [Dehalococcoidia bacterium]|nr:response regulator [Dehalococcoidia bacterium]